MYIRNIPENLYKSSFIPAYGRLNVIYCFIMKTASDCKNTTTEKTITILNWFPHKFFCAGEYEKNGAQKKKHRIKRNILLDCN